MSIDLESNAPLDGGFERATPEQLAAEHGLPPLPPIDPQNSIGYEAIRYVSGYTAQFCQNYALQYALGVLRARGIHPVKRNSL